MSVVTAALLARRLGVASPLLLVLAGAGIGLFPSVSATAIKPEWILGGVLPPLLYSAAINIPNTDFRRNLKPITGLAVVLVVVSTGAAGVLFHVLIPEIGWPAAFALAAVLSPTDAVAATSVGRRLGLPSRLLVILEGEGLVNDATALVLLRSAVGAMGAGITAGGIIGDFVLAVVGAVAVGVIVGIANVHIRRAINDPVMNTAISFVVPFVAYIPAEDFGFSGVLAVVVAGLVTSDLSGRYLRAQDRVSEETNWRTLAFLMEGFIFLLMGISLEDVLSYAGDKGFAIGEAVLYGIVAALFLILVRFLFVVPMVAMIRRDDRKAANSKEHVDEWRERIESDDIPADLPPRRAERLETRVAMVSADIEFRMRQSLGWRAGTVLAWSGMRGAVTVAAALTLPVDTPYRAELVLIAYVGAAVMLLLQGSTLPWMIKRLRIEGDDPELLREQYGELVDEMAAAGNRVLDEAREGDVDEGLVERVRRDSLVRRGVTPTLGDFDDYGEKYLELRLRVLRAERERLLHHRAIGTFSSEVLDHARRALDLQEAKLQQIADNDVLLG